jgi:hypothetical protein
MKNKAQRDLRAWLKAISSNKLVSTLVAVGFFTGIGVTSGHAAFISLNTTNYSQNFDTLGSRPNSKDLPPGWAEKQFGAEDNKILADNGSGTAGGVYNYGADGSTDRALGTLRENGDHALFGANFQNTGDGAITRLNISYTGEEWRLGAAGRGADRLQFQYSVDAHSLSSGTWINAPSLDFVTPNLEDVGAHDGNLAANRTDISGSIGFLNIPVGETFWLRWVDVTLPGGGPGEGLAIDDFSITAIPEASTLAAGIGMALLLGFMVWKRGAVRAAEIKKCQERQQLGCGLRG